MSTFVAGKTKGISQAFLNGTKVPTFRFLSSESNVQIELASTPFEFYASCSLMLVVDNKITYLTCL